MIIEGNCKVIFVIDTEIQCHVPNHLKKTLTELLTFLVHFCNKLLMYGALLLSPVPSLNYVLNHQRTIFSKRFSFSTDRYLASDLAIYKCAVYR